LQENNNRSQAKKKIPFFWNGIFTLYCSTLFLSAAYLYRITKWLDSLGYSWLRPGILTVTLSIFGLLLVIQVVRVISEKRYVNLLFFIIIGLSFFPAYFNLERPLERFHLLQYSILGILVFRVLAPRRYSLQFYLLSLNILLLVAYTDEILQGFFADRVYDIQDIWINIFSGIIGILFLRVMDLNSPLSLHPKPRKEHAAPVNHFPLIDLHIYKTDVLFCIPIIVVLLANLVLISPFKIKDRISGQWFMPGEERYALSLAPDKKALVDFPCCKIISDYGIEGNLLDGFRLKLTGMAILEEEPPACRGFIRKKRYYLRFDQDDQLMIFAKGWGTFYKKPEKDFL